MRILTHEYKLQLIKLVLTILCFISSMTQVLHENINMFITCNSVLVNMKTYYFIKLIHKTSKNLFRI